LNQDKIVNILPRKNTLNFFIKLFIFFIVFFLFVSSPSKARATGYYVDSINGSDSNPGISESQPWQSLHKVMQQSFQPGDIVQLKSGSRWQFDGFANRYGLEIDDSGTVSNPITFTTYGDGDRPVISNPPVVPNTDEWMTRGLVIFGNYVVIEGIKFEDVHDAAVRIKGSYNTVQNIMATKVGCGVSVEASGNLITQNYFYNLRMIRNTPDGDDDFGAVGAIVRSSNNEISYNTIINAKDASYDYTVDGGGIELYGTTDSNIIHHNWVENSAGFLEVGGGSAKNNKVYYNVSYNNARFSFFHVSGNFASDVDNFRVENNTVIQTVDDPKAWSQFAFSDELSRPDRFILRNNIVYQIDMTHVSNINNFTHAHNLYYYEGGDLGFVPGEGEIVDSNPQFEDIINKNLHLLSSSLAIDTGTNLGYTVDFDNNSVPYGSAPDLGAYEYGGSLPTSSPSPSPSPTPTPVPSPSLGDINEDGLVDSVDMQLLLSAWGSHSGPEDINGDSWVNSLDAAVVIKDWTGGGQTPVSLERRVSQGTDDAEECLTNNSSYLTSSDLEFVRDDNSGGGSPCTGEQVVGIRFQNITIPQGATVASAYLEFTVDETDTESTNLTFHAENTDNSSTFTSTSYNITNRPKTSSFVSGDNLPSWYTVGITHQTPDLSSIIQEVLNRPGWQSGNALTVIVNGTGQRTAEAYEGSASQASLLHVEYSSP